MKIRTLLVDDHAMFRAGLRLLVGSTCVDATVVGETSTGTEAIQLAASLTPDLIIMDIHLPDMNGIEVSREILARFPHTKIIIVSGDPDLTYINQALQAGVLGFLSKESASEELPRAFASVIQGKRYLCPSSNAIFLEQYAQGASRAANPKPTLSQRELQVLHGIVNGRRTKEIADELGIAGKTVETHRRRLMKKLDCAGTAQLVRFALEQQLVK
jgi:DNA-binding NarL/FixJ family response regulator